MERGRKVASKRKKKARVPNKYKYHQANVEKGLEVKVYQWQCKIEAMGRKKTYNCPGD